LSLITVYINNQNKDATYSTILNYTVPPNDYQFVLELAGDSSLITNLAIVSQPAFFGTTDGGAKYNVTFPNTSATYNIVLTCVESSITYRFNIQFNINGGSVDSGVSCITAGQRILTPDGYRLIEELQTGDLILTSDKRPVKAIVHKFTIPVTDRETAPITIPANFFYYSYPPKAITLSPYHKIFVRDGEWITPKKLNKINGEVKQFNINESVTYYHVKTPNFYKDHLVVEGCIIESLLE
jgi:hypothetical protein